MNKAGVLHVEAVQLVWIGPVWILVMM